MSGIISKPATDAYRSGWEKIWDAPTMFSAACFGCHIESYPDDLERYLTGSTYTIYEADPKQAVARLMGRRCAPES